MYDTLVKVLDSDRHIVGFLGVEKSCCNCKIYGDTTYVSLEKFKDKAKNNGISSLYYDKGLDKWYLLNKSDIYDSISLNLSCDSNKLGIQDYFRDLLEIDLEWLRYAYKGKAIVGVLRELHSVDDYDCKGLYVVLFGNIHMVKKVLARRLEEHNLLCQFSSDLYYDKVCYITLHINDYLELAVKNRWLLDTSLLHKPGFRVLNREYDNYKKVLSKLKSIEDINNELLDKLRQ